MLNLETKEDEIIEQFHSKVFNNTLDIYEDNENYYVYNNHEDGYRLQSSLSKGELPIHSHPYFEVASLIPLYCENFKSLLTLGLGAGTIPKYFNYYYPEVKQTAVELDDAMVAIAKKYGKVKADIVNGDALQYVRESKETFDAIVIDIFNHSGIPEEIIQEDFFTKAYEMSNEVLFINICCLNGSHLHPKLKKIIKFANDNYKHIDYYHRGFGNIVIMAYKSQNRTTMESLVEKSSQEIISRSIKKINLQDTIIKRYKGEYLPHIGTIEGMEVKVYNKHKLQRKSLF